MDSSRAFCFQNSAEEREKMIEWLRCEHDEQYEEKNRLERINFKNFR
jgi:hypothetical protein